MRLDANGNVLKVSKVLADFTFDSPMHMMFGPNGSLYLVEWGDGDNGAGIYRIDHVTSGNRAPVAAATGTPTSGRAPLTVEFSAAGSADPDGDPLGYAWDFTSDGTTDATTPAASHTYTDEGNYTATLTVTDSNGGRGTATVAIGVGNTAPVIRFTTPAGGGQFGWGDRVNYRITGTDPEDGGIDCAKVTVVAALGHDDHSHDTGQAQGCRGTITTSSDHGDYANTYFKLTARYTDSGGLPATATAILQPKHKQAEYFTGSSGIRVVEQGDAENGKRIGDISPGDWISFKPMSLVGTTSIAYRVSSPYGGGTIELRVGSPTGQLLGSTSVPNTGGWDNYETLPGTPIGALGGGNRELFLVFRSAEENHFDVDSFTWGGPGVGLPPG